MFSMEEDLQMFSPVHSATLYNDMQALREVSVMSITVRAVSVCYSIMLRGVSDLNCQYNVVLTRIIDPQSY